LKTIDIPSTISGFQSNVFRNLTPIESIRIKYIKILINNISDLWKINFQIIRTNRFSSIPAITKIILVVSISFNDKSFKSLTNLRTIKFPKINFLFIFMGYHLLIVDH
jgi:hypothetical protein